MLDGKIQKLIRLLDQHIESGRKSLLKKGIDSKLDEIAEKLEEIETKLENRRSEVAAQLGTDDKQIKLAELDSEGGFAFRATNRYEMAINKIYEVLSIKPRITIICYIYYRFVL